MGGILIVGLLWVGLALFIYHRRYIGAVLFGICFSPLLIVSPVLMYLVEIQGCQINEGGAGPCFIGGSDVSGLAELAALTAAWGLFVSLPVGAIIGFCILVYFLLFRD